MAVDKLTQQILSQGTTSQWSGEGFGSAEANAKNMAEILAGIGITDIRQFGKIPNYQPVEQVGFTYNGMTVQNPRPGLYYVQEPAYDGEGSLYFNRRDLSPEEAKQVKPIYGVRTGEDEGIPTYNTNIDQASVTTKDGKLVATTGETFGNKVTGQAVPNTYSERQTENAWGGTFAGKGNTGYRVNFTDDGTPVFYTTGASSRDSFVSSILPMVTLALPFAAPALAGTIGSSLAGGTSAATQAAIGNAVIQGTLAEAQGGDFLKGAFTGAAGSLATPVSTGISEAVGGGMLGNAIGQGVTSAGKAALTGGNVEQALVLGALGGAAKPLDVGVNNPSTLTPAQIEAGLGTPGYGYGAQAAASGLFDPSMIGSNAYTTDVGLNSPLTMAQIESGLGTPGYGYGAQAAESGLFDPEMIGSNAYALPDYMDNIDVGGGWNPAGDTSNPSLNPDNIDAGGGWNPAEVSPMNDPTKIPWDQVGKLLAGLFATTAATQMAPQPTSIVDNVLSPYKPIDNMPVYDPAYFQSVQNYYNTYLPDMPMDVATPLSSWYNSADVQPDQFTASLFNNQ